MVRKLDKIALLNNGLCLPVVTLTLMNFDLTVMFVVTRRVLFVSQNGSSQNNGEKFKLSLIYSSSRWV